MYRRFGSFVVIVAVILVLLSPAYADVSPSPSPSDSGGGHSSGGGAGRRGWLDTYAPEFVDDGSNLIPSNQDTSGAYLSLDHVDSDGKYYYLVNNFEFSSAYLSSLSSFECTTGSFIYITGVQSAYNQIAVKFLSSGLCVPVSGDYSLQLNCSDCSSYLGYNTSDTRLPDLFVCGYNSLSYSPFVFTPGSSSNAYNDCHYDLGSVYPDITIKLYFKTSYFVSFRSVVYLVCEPDDYLVYTSIGTIIGDVVVIGDNNETTVYKDCQFVDETNNQYYNPTTNTWYTYNSYSYDYSTFTYNFTTDSGNTTINYGDEYITITEVTGDTTNNYYYYYYVDDGGSGDDDDTCDHVYTSEVTREPSCTMTGITTYTCTKCGNQYTTTIDALGHDWLLKDSVPTTYSVDTSAITCPDDGSTDFTYMLDEETETYTFTNTNTDYTWTVPATVTDGYDFYECSRCGETYRDYDGSGPPDDEDGLFAAIGDFIADGIAWILDKLAQLVESIITINDAFTSYIEDLKAVGGEYPSFISGIVAILPDDFMTVVWFGVISSCAVLAYKRWFK